jgi:murein DD-endopeptidase MepM/ murein hydrolase activator NlpD
MAVAVFVLLLGATALAIPRGGGGGDGGTEPRADDAEVVLDESAPAAARRRQRDEPRRGERPTVVQALPPGQRAEQERGSDDEPPAHIAAQDRQLRRELDHLKSLEADRRRAARKLDRALALYGGPVGGGGGELLMPVGGSITSPFGPRWGRLHAGIDIAVPAGAPIRAAETGRVVIASPTGGYGNYVCVQHTRALTTCYAHLSRFLTTPGDVLRQGDVLGLVGCTGHCFGDHLHFETWVRGRPVDPMPYL